MVASKTCGEIGGGDASDADVPEWDVPDGGAACSRCSARRSCHFVIAAAAVLLAIFIIAVDCLPVLSKMMSGTTWYDDILEFRLRIAERMAADAMKVTERQATSRDEIELSRIESRVRTEEKHEIYPLVHRK
jgi:hypothetical protein